MSGCWPSAVLPLGLIHAMTEDYFVILVSIATDGQEQYISTGTGRQEYSGADTRETVRSFDR